jgi:hypothetical protein
MGSIVKRSPGFVDVEGRLDTLDEISEAFSAFAKNSATLKGQYNELHAYQYTENGI